MSSDEGNINNVMCPSCGGESLAGKFCTACGAALGAGSGIVDMPPQSAKAVEMPGKGVFIETFNEISQSKPIESSSDITMHDDYRRLYTGARVGSAEIVNNKCGACDEPILRSGKSLLSLKVCPHCHVSFLREHEPLLKVYGVLTKPLVVGRIEDLHLRIENWGEIKAYNVSAEFSSISFEMNEDTEEIDFLLPGHYSILPINLKFKSEGVPRAKVRLLYHDSHSEKYYIEKHMKLVVWDKPNPAIESELKKKPENQVVINIENFVSGDLKKGNFTEIVNSVINRSSIGTDNVAIERQETVTQTTTTQPVPPAPVKAQPDVYYEVDAELGFTCDNVSRVFRIICAPALRIGREGPRDDALTNHIALGSDRYLSRKQLQITPVDDGFLFDQGESPRRISCRGDISDQSFNLTGEEKFQIKVDKAGNLVDMKFKPFCDYRTPLALFMNIKGEKILFVSGSIKLRWDPSNPDMLDISNIAPQTAGHPNEPYMNQNAVLKHSGCTLKVKRIIYSKISRCFESNKWSESVYQIEKVHSGTSAHKPDPDATVCDTSYGLKEPCEFSIIYDSAALGLWVKPI